MGIPLGPVLLLEEPPPRLVELLKLHTLEELEKLQARRRAIVHMFDSRRDRP